MERASGASARADVRLTTVLVDSALTFIDVQIRFLTPRLSGPMFAEIASVFPTQKMIDHTSMNTWEDENVIKEVNRIGKSRIVLGGLWTGVCIVEPRDPERSKSGCPLRAPGTRGGLVGAALRISRAISKIGGTLRGVATNIGAIPCQVGLN